jgi:chromosome segregation ATPase
MASKDDNKNDSYSLENQLHDIHDLTTRIDERVKTIFKQQSESDKKLEKVRDNYNGLMNKMNTIEVHELPCLNKKIIELKDDVEALLEKIQKFESEAKDLKNFKRSTEERIKFACDIIYKILMTIGCGYIGYCLGWNK